MFRFAGYVNGGTDQLTVEQRFSALSGYAIYEGAALKLSAGCLCLAATTADLIYAISNYTGASSVVTAALKPRVFPVNKNQVWACSCAVEMAAGIVINGTGVALDSACATGVDGAVLSTAALMYWFVTGGTPASGGVPGSAAWVVFESLLIP